MDNSKAMDGEERTGSHRDRTASTTKKGRPSQSGDRQQTLLTQAFIVKESEKDSVTIVDRLEMLQKTTDYLKLLIENNACSHTANR